MTFNALGSKAGEGSDTEILDLALEWLAHFSSFGPVGYLSDQYK